MALSFGRFGTVEAASRRFPPGLSDLSAFLKRVKFALENLPGKDEDEAVQAAVYIGPGGLGLGLGGRF